MKVGKYDVSSCNKRGEAYPSACRVKLDGVILAEVFTPHRDPYRWLRTRPRDPARREFVEQLREMEIPEEDIKMLLSMHEKNSA